MKYFCCSDIHGHYYQWIRDLKEVGYDKDNPNHTLIVLGDIFDRGRQPLEIYNFLKSIPKERRILVRGNHEILLKDLVQRGYAESHDKHNGTWQTLLDLSIQPTDSEFQLYISENYYKNGHPTAFEYDSEGKCIGWTREYKQYQDTIDEEFEKRKRKVTKNSLVKEIINWIDSDEWVNYYETKDYIFVHSWIPLQEHIDWEKSASYGFTTKSGPDTFREDWRNATQQEWDDAMWGCPWKKAKDGLNQTGKTIVCGHWHTSDFFNNLKNKNNTKKYGIGNNPIFKSKRYKLIGLDACTTITLLVNVFIFEE